MMSDPLVSIIIAVHNGEKFINDCFESITQQDALSTNRVEISVCNDSSTDNTKKLLLDWEKKISSVSNLSIVTTEGGTDSPKGVGYARNKAISQSRGIYLCFQDIDDVMLPSRIRKQLEAAQELPNAIIGCQVKRLPENSTLRFIKWANNLPQHLLTKQIFTSHGPTILMPTWFFHRSVYERVGKFSEAGKGTPEDLLFFYNHLDAGGTLRRIDEVLLIYRYHSDATTFSVDEKTIWDIRLSRLESKILPKWETFTIWNAGKQGRQFFRSLQPENRKKVVGFCDVDENKIGKYYVPYSKLVGDEAMKIPIFRFSEAKPPIVICFKLDLSNGEFEKNLNSLNLEEGVDYILFS